MTKFEWNGDFFEHLAVDPKKPDTYVGRTSHRLTVIGVCMRVTEGKAREKYCMCKCECGIIKIVNTRGIRSQRIKSCGCWKSEVDTAKAKAMGAGNVSHGKSYSRIYKIWDSMIYRCTNSKAKEFMHYGGRGITYDPRWASFEAFYDDMRDGYEDHLTIERLDVNGNYEKANCTWIPMEEQAGNKRNTIRITHDGTTRTLVEWSKILGIKASIIRQRYYKGLSSEQILRKPPLLRRKTPK